MSVMDRRQFLIGLSSGITLLGSGACGRRPAPSSLDRPNILLIFAEDICPDLGCYGEPVVHTPHIDRFAAESILYRNAFATCPVCSPSRSAVMTGMFQTTIGAHHHRSHRDDGYRLPPPVRPITEHLRANGYFTANGCGFSSKTDFNFSTEAPVFEGKDWSERRPGQPFFAQVTLPVTHRRFKRDPRNPIDPADVVLPPYYPDTRITRRDWADYLESIQLMDSQVGEIMDRLDREGLKENTVVFFAGDNGRCHVRGKQWLYEGGIHVPLIVRWPVKFEGGIQNEALVSIIDLTASILDAAGIGVPGYMQGRSLFEEQGESRDYIVAARDRCDETADRIRCVRTSEFKYIRNFFPERSYLQTNVYKYRQYPVLTLMRTLQERGQLTAGQAHFMAEKRPVEELYDLQTDPHEINNLAGEEKYSTELIDLRKRLDNWMNETGDKGEKAEDPAIVEYWTQEAQKRLKNFMARRGLPLDISDADYLKWWKGELLK